MEASEEDHSHHHHLDVETHEADDQQQHDRHPQLCPKSSPPPPPDPLLNLDPPPLASGDLDQQFVNVQRHQTQEIIDREFQNLVLDDRDRDRREAIEGEDEEIEYENSRRGGYSIAAGEPNDGNRGYQYPVRPGADDCSFYVRTGNCKFGSTCKFNHPPRRRNEAGKEYVKDKEESPEQTECKYYLRSGGCKYGPACRYTHSRRNTPIAPLVDLNFLGLPIRPGEKECPYYMRNGSCKYGSQCRFNHPNPTAVMGGGDSPSFTNGAPHSTLPSWSLPRAMNENASFVTTFSQTREASSSNSERNNGHQQRTPDRRLPTPPSFSTNNPATEPNLYTHHYNQQPQRMMMMGVEEFPERPDQPECSYFMKTGDCKFRSGCKFHHPKNRITIPNTTTPSCALSDKGLPLRPDEIVCLHYSRYGICKFGPACKFDHPINFAAHSSSPSSAVPGPDHHRPHLGEPM